MGVSSAAGSSAMQMSGMDTISVPSSRVDDNGMIVESTPDGEWTYDPNEPRYCICNQVSYGDMVACDNDVVSSRGCGREKEIVIDCFFVHGLLVYFPVSVRVVPLSVRGHNAVTEGQVVLSTVHVIDEAQRIQEDLRW